MKIMSEKKFYEVPEEVKEYMYNWEVYFDLKEHYVKRPFGFKDAVRCGKLAAINKKKYWEKVYELYPEFVNVKLNVNGVRDFYIVREDNKDDSNKNKDIEELNYLRFLIEKSGFTIEDMNKAYAHYKENR
jgi:hypothetical protein